MCLAYQSGKDTKLFLPDEYYQKLDANIAKAIEARDAEVAWIKRLSKTKQSNVATKNPNLSDVDRALLQEGLDKANFYINKIEELFDPYGGIN